MERQRRSFIEEQKPQAVEDPFEIKRNTGQVERINSTQKAHTWAINLHRIQTSLMPTAGFATCCRAHDTSASTNRPWRLSTVGTSFEGRCHPAPHGIAVIVNHQITTSPFMHASHAS